MKFVAPRRTCYNDFSIVSKYLSLNIEVLYTTARYPISLTAGFRFVLISISLRPLFSN